MVPLHFLGSKSTISRFGERFRDGQQALQFGQFLVCCFSAHGAPRAQPFVKVGRARAPVPHGVGATELIASLCSFYIRN